MFYATRTHEIADGINEKQLLAFYTKKHRDEYVTFEDGEAITAKQKNGLMPIGQSHAVSGTQGVFFVQRVM